MGLDYHFKNVDTLRDLILLRDFSLSQPLDYPKYEKWILEKCIPDIERGRKSAIVVYHYGNLIGSAIYQQYEGLPRTCEFKHMRIDPNFRDIDIGHFNLRQVEEEAKRSGNFDRIILDIRAGQKGIKNFLFFCKYKVLFEVPLYDDRLDIVMGRELFGKSA